MASAIADSRIENNRRPTRSGCVRNFRTRDGGMIREQSADALGLRFECTYSILESPMGPDNYVATLKLTPVTDGDRTFAEWSAEFDCDEPRERELTQNIGRGCSRGGSMR